MSFHDVAIIGSGPAGCAAAIYAARELLDVVVLEKGDFGGQIAQSSEVQNYPGVASTDGYSLMADMRAQAESFGAKFNQTLVNAIVSADYGFNIETIEADSIQTKAVIACLGASPSRAGFTGEEEFTGRGVSYCATCDAMFYRNKQVFVCGGGNTAAEEALFLARFASKVILVVRRDHMRAEAGLVKRLGADPRIEILYNTNIVSVSGSELISRIILLNNSSHEESAVEFEEGSVGIFVCVGSRPNTQLLSGLVDLDSNGYVITGNDMRTSRQGIFAAGDCRGSILKQVVTAVSDGAIAAVSAARYLKECSI